jgi:hypothetical protein
MIIENVIAGLTRNLLIVFGNWGIAGQTRNDEARQFEMHPKGVFQKRFFDTLFLDLD